MNVFNPEEATNTLKIIPRFYPVGEVTVLFKDEASKEMFTQSHTPIIANGYLSVFITHEFKDRTNYQVEINTDDEVVYRGKVYVTTQAEDTQDFKISKDIFTYE